MAVASRGEAMKFGLNWLSSANPPASVGVANSTACGRYNNRWDNRHARHHYSAAAVVRTAVVAIATASAIGTAMEPEATSTGDFND